MGIGITVPGLTIHGHSYHTNVIRELFIPPHATTTGTATYKVGQPTLLFDATGEYAYGSFRIPPNYVSGGKLYLCWMSDNVIGTYVINSALQAGADNESYNTHNDTDNDRTIAVGAGDRYGYDDTGLDLSALSVGDMVGIKVDRDANTTQNIHIIGWVFEYTARE